MKFKVIKEFNLNGVIQSLDSIIELDKTMASLKSIQENIEKVPDNQVVGDGSVLSTIISGIPVTEEQKKKLAEENVAETNEAQRLAAEHRARDIAEGKGEPAVKIVADALKDKLEKEEFSANPVPPPPPPAE